MNTQFDTQVICVDEALKLSFGTEELGDLVQDLKDDDLFSGKLGEAYGVRTSAAGGRPRNTVFVGLGQKNEANYLFRLESGFGQAIKAAKEMGAQSVVAWLDDRINEEETAKAIEAMHLAKYRFEKYKTKDKKEEISVAVSSPHSMKEMAEEAILLAQQTCMARDLVNEPSNVLYPETLADAAIAQGEKCGFFVDVYDQEYIASKGMSAFLSVGRGSSKPPRLIVLRYDGGGNEKIGLVGKGLTFDTGGYSIKTPYSSMTNMKSDMAGAAAVIGAIGAIAKAKLPIKVVGVIASCENMISGNAYKVDDIVTSMSGKTILVENTDAEGRLTLADAVTYALEVEKVDRIIDIATLTGAVIVALGSGITGVVTNNQEFYKKLEDGARTATEKVWQLPNDYDTVKQLKSNIADLKNMGDGRGAGTMLGAQFVGEFAGRTPWIHLDIAGTSFAKDGTAISPAGATGVGVRTLYQTVKRLSITK